MIEGRPSQTAVATAFLRALHVAVTEAPYVFEDTAAAAYLPAGQQAYLERLRHRILQWPGGSGVLRRRALPDIGTQVLVRSRYAEDKLNDAVRRGCRRYIVLGAGLDTYAERHRGDDSPLTVVEIDHPATQAWKRARLAEKGLPTLRAVTYLPVDFERTRLDERLNESDAPQFVSWLGTTYYLTRQAIAATLADLCEHSAPGSELVLDYFSESRLLHGNPLLEWGLRFALAMQPEPLRSFFDPAEMEQLATRAGWHVREHCAPEIQNARYLTDRRDGLRVPRFAFLLHLEK